VEPTDQWLALFRPIQNEEFSKKPDKQKAKTPQA
jgi:hypothetical protein